MSNQQTPNPNPQNEEPQEQRKYPQAAYNTEGWVAQSCIFRITKDQFEKAVLKIAKGYIKDFYQCIFEPGHNGNNALLLWLPSDSEHLINKRSTQGTYLKRPVKEYSQELREFMKKFCRETPNSPPVTDSRYRFGTVIGLNQYDNAAKNYTAIVVNPKIFMDILFDCNGVAYQKEFSEKRATYTDVTVEMCYEKDSRRKLSGMKVIKSTRSSGDGTLHTKNMINT